VVRAGGGVRSSGRVRRRRRNSACTAGPAADSPTSRRPTPAAGGRTAARARRTDPVDTNAARTPAPITKTPSTIVAGLLTATSVTEAATYPAATVTWSSRDESRHRGNDRTQWIRGPRCSANKAIGPNSPPWKLPRNQAYPVAASSGPVPLPGRRHHPSSPPAMKVHPTIKSGIQCPTSPSPYAADSASSPRPPPRAPRSTTRNRMRLNSRGWRGPRPKGRPC
jgi:hypothetical protein